MRDGGTVMLPLKELSVAVVDSFVLGPLVSDTVSLPVVTGVVP